MQETSTEPKLKNLILTILSKIKKFLVSFQGKILLINITFTVLALAGFLFASYYINYNMLIQEKSAKLEGYANTLIGLFGDETYNEILIRLGAEDYDRDDKIGVLAVFFQERTEIIANIEKGLGVGYYNKELDAIISYGPYAEFKNKIGASIAIDHPGRTVMEENKTKVISGKMVRGNILNAMVPIVIDGEVIGYVWANESTVDIEEQYNRVNRIVTYFFVIAFVVIIFLTSFVTSKLFKDVTRIVEGVNIINSNLDHRILNVKGELNVVASSINNMANNIQIALEEKEAYAISEASRKAQKDFLARMSHEIRTPMNGVLGMTRMAINCEDAEQRTVYLHKIQQSAALLLGIINDILDFSKIEAGKLDLDYHNFKLMDIVNNISELIDPKIKEKNNTFKIEISENIPSDLLGDSLRLSQILLNLIGNAAKFTENGTITLSILSKESTDSDVLLFFEVKDTGIGMSDEQQEHLFTPFSQADTSTARKFGGTGLGLSISKALVEQMGGELSVSSSIGDGSTFYFELRMNLATETNDFVEENLESINLSDLYTGVKALLVEDNEINQEIASALLSEYNLEIDIANNGLEAVEKYKTLKYQLIFMDIQMPIMDGLEATRTIRSLEENSNTHIPIIAMTANAMQDDRIATKEAGMDDHLSKPFEIKELNQVLLKTIKIIKK
ncbi:MAG: response regulator [Acholeplasmatales bacterium]|jgi:signal transduction histidine kinase/ActR/RegA family two-component response regulator|nr:response regulator [Acholeplasmatales bacterium]